MEYDIDHVKDCMLRMTNAATKSRELLTRLDSMCGDGDLGISMDLGARVISRIVTQYKGNDISALLTDCAMMLNREAPSTMGTLISKALTSQAAYLPNPTRLTEKTLVEMPSLFANAIMLIGGAQRGDKTVLDSLIPLAETFRESYHIYCDFHKATNDACAAAVRGALDTRGCLAKIGRAKWFAERSKNCPDGGAVFCALMMQAAIGEELLPMQIWLGYEEREEIYV